MDYYKLNPDNDYIRDKLGITAWHEAGFKGDGIKIGTAEEYDPTVDNKDDHDGRTTNICLEIAPNVTFVDIDTRYLFENKPFRASHIDQILDECKEKNIIGLFRSQSSGTSTDEWESVHDSKFDAMPTFSWFNSAGNDYYKGEKSRYIAENAIWGVGACRMMADGQLVMEGYSSESVHVDFVGVAQMWVSGSAFAGTSCSAPQVATAMLALVQAKCNADTGRYMTRDEQYKFILAHCVDKNYKKTNGVRIDDKWGFGLLILPKPETIIWEDYMAKATETTDIIETFTDKEQISAWAVDAVRNQYTRGIMKGTSDTTFAPKSNITREQLAVVNERTIEYILSEVSKMIAGK